jgi:hypothetical protein
MPAAMIVRVIVAMMVVVIMPVVVMIVRRAPDRIGAAFGRERGIDLPAPCRRLK